MEYSQKKHFCLLTSQLCDFGQFSCPGHKMRTINLIFKVLSGLKLHHFKSTNSMGNKPWKSSWFLPSVIAFWRPFFNLLATPPNTITYMARNAHIYGKTSHYFFLSGKNVVHSGLISSYTLGQALLTWIRRTMLSVDVLYSNQKVSKDKSSK